MWVGSLSLQAAAFSALQSLTRQWLYRKRFCGLSAHEVNTCQHGGALLKTLHQHIDSHRCPQSLFKDQGAHHPFLVLTHPGLWGESLSGAARGSEGLEIIACWISDCGGLSNTLPTRISGIPATHPSPSQGGDGYYLPCQRRDFPPITTQPNVGSGKEIPEGGRGRVRGGVWNNQKNPSRVH